MLKFGIYDVRQLSRRRISSFFGSKQSISIELYDRLAQINQRDREFISGEILRKFSTGFAFKRTYHGRFEAFDDAVLALAAQHLAPGRDYRVHDIGVSDGRTACDFYRALIDRYELERVEFCASDYAPYVYLIGDGKWLRIAVDEQG